MFARKVLTLLSAVVCFADYSLAAEISTENLYRAFFQHVTFLQSRSQALSADNPDRAALGSFYETTLQLAASEATALTSTSAAANAAVVAQDAKAQVIITQFRTLYPAGKLLTGAPRPVAPPELAALWSERGTIIDTWIETLHSQVGDATFAKIDAYVRSQFANHVSPVVVGSADSVVRRQGKIRASAGVVK